MNNCILVTDRNEYYFMIPDAEVEPWDDNFSERKVLEIIKLTGWGDWKYAVKIKIDNIESTFFINFKPEILLNEYNEIINEEEANRLLEKTDSFFMQIGEGIDRLCPRHTSFNNNGGWAGACWGCVDIGDRYCTHEGDYKKRYGDCISLKEFMFRLNRK